jgi:hypothetical protein
MRGKNRKNPPLNPFDLGKENSQGWFDNSSCEKGFFKNKNN